MAAILVFTAAGCAVKNIDIRTFPSGDRAISELLSGQVDAVVGDYPVIAFEARESAGRLVVTGRQFDIQTLGIGTDKDSVPLREVITDALRKIMADKTYFKVLLAWAVTAGKIDPPPHPAVMPQLSEVPQLKDGKLKVGVELSYPPMEFFDEFKRESGVDVELTRAIGKVLGVEAVFVDMPFDALIDAVDTGKVDIIFSSMAITEERLQRIDFIPYIAMGSGILVKKGNPNNIRKLADLCGRAVAVQDATSQLSILRLQICE